MIPTEESLYKEFILDLYKNPLNKGIIKNATHVCKQFNQSCGDEIEIMLQVDEYGTIVQVAHEGHGCAISQASVSLLTEEIKNKKMEEVQSLNEKFVISLLNIPISENRIKCATLGLKALKKACFL